MRISDDMTFRMLSSGISGTKQSVYDLQQQISSGRKVSKPSDDPGTYEAISRLKDDLSAIQQYSRNVESLDTDLKTVEGSLAGMTDLFQRVQEIIVKGGDATCSPADRTSLANEVDGLLNQLIDIANTSQGGRYIFGGLRSDTAPYTGTDTIPTDGLIDTITYNGSTQTRNVEISKGIYIEANIPGSDAAGTNAVFKTSQVDLFQVLIDLRNNLIAGNNTSQTTDLDMASKALDHILGILSTVGAREEQVTINKDLLSQRESNILSALDQKESIDIAEATISLAERQLAYQAALKSASMIINQRTLIDMI